MTSNRQKYISLCEKYNIQYGPKEDRNALDLYSKQPYVGKRCWLIAYKAEQDKIYVADGVVYPHIKILGPYDEPDYIGYKGITLFKSESQIKNLIKQYNTANSLRKQYLIKKKLEDINEDFN
jgi:hypothetical protein